MIYFLDTHILVWWVADRKRLSSKQREVLAEVVPEHPVWISQITLWEIATLNSLGRLQLDRPLRAWLEQATAPPLVRRASITPAIAALVAELPDSFHRDPGDRIIVATAQIKGAMLLTSDQRILDADIIQTIP